MAPTLKKTGSTTSACPYFSLGMIPLRHSQSQCAASMDSGPRVAASLPLLVPMVLLLTSLSSIVAATAGQTTASRYPQVKLKRGSRVVIVGGGPAGVHFGTLLAAKGVTQITLLEAEKEVGGKTLNVHLENDPVPHAMGAIFLGDFYSPVFKPLLRKYTPGNRLLDADPLAKKDSYIVMSGRAGQSDYDTSGGMDFWQYILWKAAMDTGLPESSPRSVIMHRLVSALLRFIRVHESIFGRYPTGMPPPPRDWSRLDMSGRDFLRANGLSVLEGIMILTYQLNGFGSLEGTPAFYLLWWMQPVVTRNLLKCVVTGRPFMVMPSEGIQKIFVNMARYHEREGSMQVKRGARVTQVTRGLTTGE